MNTIKPSLFLYAMLLIISPFAFAQDLIDRKLKDTGEWSEGSIMQNDGTESTGMLQYNENIGVLSFESGGTTRTLTANSVVAFEFFDVAENKQRIFYSLHYEDKIIAGRKTHFFFEVLKEFKTFAVLSKKDPTEVKERKPSEDPLELHATLDWKSTFVFQTETIFIMDPDGRIMPYVKIVEKDVKHALNDFDQVGYERSATKNTFINEDLLEKYTGDYYGHLILFANENKLSFRRKKDLIRVLKYYQELTQ